MNFTSAIAGPSIVVVGSLNMDMVLEVPRAAAPGETVVGRKLTFVPGGKGANQAVAAARLGAKVAMVGRVGGDDFGARLRRALIGDDIDVEYVGTALEIATGTALIVVEDSGQNQITIVPGANGRLTGECVEQAATIVDGAALLLLQLEIPLQTVMSVIERAASRGARVILNPAPAQHLPESVWAKVDYLIPNESEASLLTGIAVTDVSSAERAARELRRRGVKQVLITLGELGVLIADDGGVRIHPAPRVRVIDTTAAGDTFIGALAVALTEGKNLDVAAQFAVEAAALSVTRRGAQSSIPYRHELDSR